MIAERINRWLAVQHHRTMLVLFSPIGVVLFAASVAFLVACAIWLD